MAFAREKFKYGSQHDSHLTEGNEVSSGIETSRNKKWGGYKAVRRRQTEASRTLIKKEKMAIKLGKHWTSRKKGRRKAEEKQRRSKGRSETVNIYKYSGQQGGKTERDLISSASVTGSVLLGCLTKTTKVFNKWVFCKTLFFLKKKNWNISVMYF